MVDDPKPKPEAENPEETAEDKPEENPVEEVGGRGGLDPSRYGDWEKNGRCIDF